MAVVKTMTKQSANFLDVPARVNSDGLEREILEYWEKEKIFELSLEQNKNKPLFTFYDGPPYATGKPHYGHILQSSIKDAILRYKTMRGFYVPRRVGWDTHGLPIEVIVEKELGFKSKKDIEDYGIEKFNKKCREAVTKYVGAFTDSLKRLGRWADYDNAYYTLDKSYMETEWWIFKQLWDQKLIYEDFRSTPYCIRCETPLSNHEVSTSYKDKVDETVYVKLAIANDNKLWLLIWTTTPWTLPANVAVAYSEDVEYVKAELNGEVFVLAKERVEDVLGGAAKVIGQISHEDLRKLTYKPLFATVSETLGVDRPPYSLIPGNHVTAEDGTGLVHIAPAFGEEDAEVGKKHGLPTLRTVTPEGNFDKALAGIGGKNIFKGNSYITGDLKNRGLLLKTQSYTHNYPHCWRCDEPLIYYALDTWFVRVNNIKEQLLKNNEKINWIPAHVKQGRFAKGLKSAPDWAVSRNRFWSVPMPIWECSKCDEQICVGSVAELQKLAAATDEQVKDIHRPYVDDLYWSCSVCAGTMSRVPEVLDVWFDSGSMPYAQWHYPFANKELVEKSLPADFIVEAIEMTRLWFYVLHVLTGALTNKGGDLGKDKPAFQNAIASGLIFAEDGQKLSKKLKNYAEPEPVFKKYGADVLRFYLLSSSSLGEPYRFSEKDMNKLRQSLYMTLWNVYSFFVRYANTHSWRPGKHQASTHILDQWILARIGQIENNFIAVADSYQIDQAARLFVNYINDLSNWYVRRSRSRFQRPASKNEAEAAFGTLHSVLVRTSMLLAPLMPFVSESMYRNLTGSLSVHLDKLVDPLPQTTEQDELIAAMAVARADITQGLALRAQSGIKVRQPLASMVSSSEVPSRFRESLGEIIRQEVNVKYFSYTNKLPHGAGFKLTDPNNPVRVAINIELTDELKAEGISREIIRHGQLLRREAKYALNDRIKLSLITEDTTILTVIDEHKQMIMQALQADMLTADNKSQDASTEIVIDGHPLYIGISKS